MSLKIVTPSRNNVLNIAEKILTVTSQSYASVAIAVSIYLSMPCSVCEGKRSVSKLSFIKKIKKIHNGIKPSQLVNFTKHWA